MCLPVLISLLACDSIQYDIVPKWFIENYSYIAGLQAIH